MSSSSQPHSLAVALEGELGRICEGRLRDLHWFRTDWQRGGAATATATWHDGNGPPREAVVKVPVNQREFRWLLRLGTSPDAPVPQVFASGGELGAYDFAWIVMERLSFGPLGLSWHPDHLRRIADAAARVQAAAAPTPLDAAASDENWVELVKVARERARDGSFPERGRWSAALKDLSKKLDRVVNRWRERSPVGWVHGDLHPANAMSRVAVDHGPVCLLDLAEMRPGHWLEDGIYLERLHWSRPERLDPSPVRCLAEARKREGLANGDYPALAAARRLLLAATAPAFRGEHSPPLLSACLSQLESGLAHA